MNPRSAFKSLSKSALVLTLLALLVTRASLATNGTPVGGPIISDTTWTLTNSPYIVIANVEVWEGVTLTIEPGVKVRFESEKLLQVKGTLVARGTPGARIVFTSNQAQSQRDDWGNIEFTDSSADATFDAGGNYTGGSVLQYCTVEYAGHDAGSAIHAPDAAPFIDHCIVRNNDSRGIRVAGTAENFAVISGNTVSDNSAGYYDGDGGGIYAYHSTVGGNSVSGNSVGNYSDGGGIYASDSTVSNNTVSGNSAGYYGGGGGGIYADYHSTVSGNIVSGNSAGYYGGGIYASNSTVSGNTVSGNPAGDYGGGIYAYNSTVSGNAVSGNSAGYYGGGIYADYHSTVSGNAVSGNSAGDYGGGIYANFSTVSGNTVSGNSAGDYGGGIYTHNSTMLANTVTANTVATGGQGAGVYHRSSSDFIGNTIVANGSPATETVGGVAIYGTPQFHHNNLYDNEPYDVEVVSSSDISGTLNYWGTVDNVDILAQVYDWYDDSLRGKLVYVPYLQDPSPDAPVPPPQNFGVTFAGNTAQLSWDPIPSTTMGYGYKVYYDSDGPGPPYEGTGLPEGDAPIDVGNLAEFTLTGLRGRRIWVTVTAYDTLGRESWYASEVVRDFRFYLPFLLAHGSGGTNSVLRVSPDRLNFHSSGSMPPSQSVFISNVGEGNDFDWTATVTQGRSWLAVNPTSGSTPTTLSVSVDAAGLSNGTYWGRVQVEAEEGIQDSPQFIDVILSVVVMLPQP